MAEMLRIKIDHPDDFLVIKETLSRIGYDKSNHDEKILEQACHILHKRGLYYIIHFKELMLLDKLSASLTAEDIQIRDTIAFLLQKWGLCEIVSDINQLPAKDTSVKVVPHKEKKNWKFVSKVQPGKKQKSV